MSNHRAETFSNSDELKGIVKAYLAQQAVDAKRCLDVSAGLTRSGYHVDIHFVYEQTDNRGKYGEPIRFWVDSEATVFEIEEKVKKAAQDIEEAEYNDLTSKDN